MNLELATESLRLGCLLGLLSSTLPCFSNSSKDVEACFKGFKEIACYVRMPAAGSNYGILRLMVDGG